MNQETIKQARDKANALKRENSRLKCDLAVFEQDREKDIKSWKARISNLRKDLVEKNEVLATERELHDVFRKETEPAIHAAESLQKTDDGEYITPGLTVSVIMDDFQILNGCCIETVSKGEFRICIKEGDNVREIGNLRAIFADPNNAKSARVRLLQAELNEAKEA